MMPIDRAEKLIAERQRREDERLADTAKRRSAKTAVTRDDVDVLMAALTPEGRAEVAMRATIAAGIRPDLPWLRR
jgi:hypothetical protein